MRIHVDVWNNLVLAHLPLVQFDRAKIILEKLLSTPFSAAAVAIEAGGDWFSAGFLNKA